MQYGKADPEAARELFIRHALVAGEWETEHAFAAHNQQEIEAVLDIEARERRSDMLVDDDTLVAFFDARLPAEVTTVRHFDRWWRDARSENPTLLNLGREDLVEPGSAQPDPAAYPEVWSYGDLGLPMEYEFDPLSPTDGITIDVPLLGLGRIDPVAFEWHVPGLRLELVTALIRSLPKHQRKAFAPVPATAAEVVRRLDPTEGGGLLQPLRRELSRIGGVSIPADAFDLGTLPAHLRPRFRVVDEAGQVVASGTDLAELKEDVRAETAAMVGSEKHELEVSGLTAWSIGTLPRTVTVTGNGHSVEAYPALIDKGQSVTVKLLATEGEQQTAMWSGTIRLLLLNLPSPGKLLRPFLSPDAKEILRVGPHQTQTEWVEDCLGCTVGEIMAEAGGPAWDATGFDRLLQRTRDELHPRVTDVARASLEVLEALANLERSFNRPGVQRYQAALTDIADQVASLIYPGFLTAIGSDRLGDVRRYLEAATRRIDRLPQDPEGDSRHMNTIHTLEANLERLQTALPDEARLIDVAWMIQELRVSLFAQILGTREKVSEKRIRKLMHDIEMG